MLEWDISASAGKKRILIRTVGKAEPGKLSCILGPSGAGKSTLLNVLAGRQLTCRGFRIDGELRANGHVVKPSKLRPQVAYVMQKNEFFATETPREAMAFSARLRLSSAQMKQVEREGGLQQHISGLIDSLGLSSCCDRPIGGQSLSGISNGEKKRVSIGVELVTQPSIVFFDEPTSGLDSFGAFQVMRIAKALAHRGCTVVCTIHQPSSEIFALVDHVICLCDRRSVFQGEVSQLRRWVELSGHPVPSNHNPADHVMFLMETGKLRRVDRAAEPHQSGSWHSAASPENPGLDSMTHARRPFRTQLRCLVGREWRRLWRDGSSLQLRLLLSLALALLFSLVFAGVGQHEVPDQLHQLGSHCPLGRRLGQLGRHVIGSRLQGWHRLGERLLHPEAAGLRERLQRELEYHYKAVVQLAFVSMFSACQPTILSFPLERAVFLREFSGNMYGSVAYFASKMFVEVPLSAIQALLALVIAHKLMLLQGDFFEMWLAMCLLCACGVSFSLLIGSFVRFPRESGAIGPLVFIPQLLMSGTFIPVRAIPSFLRWMQYLSFLQYAVKLLSIVEFRRSDPLLRRLIFKTMEVNADFEAVYFGCLVVLCLCFSCTAVVLLSRRAQSIY